MRKLTSMTVSEEEVQRFPEVPPQGLRGEGFVHPQTISPAPLGYVVPGDGPVDQKRNGVYDWSCFNYVYGEDYYVYAIADTQEHRARGWRCIYCGALLLSSEEHRQRCEKTPPVPVVASPSQRQALCGDLPDPRWGGFRVQSPGAPSALVDLPGRGLALPTGVLRHCGVDPGHHA